MTSPAKLPDTRAFQRIVEYVERALAAGELKAGDRLPSERELVERFGVGRSSVREALRVLENMELVRSAPRDPRGPLVLAYSVGPVRRSLAMLTSARTITLPGLVQFRMIVDASANLMAAARRTDEQLRALERNMARMRESMGIGYAGALASRLARETLYAYYADHVEPADRAIMADLVRECGGRVPV